MELELNSLDWNGNELEHELELEDMKRNTMYLYFTGNDMLVVFEQLFPVFLL